MTVSAVTDRPEELNRARTQSAVARPFLRELIDAVDERLNERRRFQATYRLQFQAPHFGFTAARDIAAYLGELGVSHVYASPCLKARRGSAHGYDIIDHSRFN